MGKLHGLKHFCSAFGYSMSGLRFALKEAAIRQELVLGVVHLFAIFFFQLPYVWGVALTVLWFLILIVEVLNTALEAVVDLASPAYHDLAKRAKDLGSFAVFLSLVLFFATWLAALAVTVRVLVI